ncbi:MAG: transposase [Gemmatimonadaceae bacterium]|nr:transposase [Gloeobacterales cyanobacterium ES-bin-141]
MQVSRDTLLRTVHRLPLAELPTPRFLGIDDWAHRKGCTYGTILVDLEARKPVALLADRRVETVAEWLRNHPGVEVISLDRSLAYRQADEQGTPTAVQVGVG